MQLTYDFKLLQELAWLSTQAALGVLGAELITINATVLDNPQAWGIALLAAAGRAAVAAVVAKLSTSGSFSVK